MDVCTPSMSYQNHRSSRGGRGARGGSRGGRGGFQTRSGPKLPSTLLEQVDATYGGPTPKGRVGLNRKDQRKASRQGRKVDHDTQGRRFHAAQSDDENEESRRHAAATRPKPPDITHTKKGKRPAVDEKDEEKPNKKRKLPELALPGADDEDVEDGEIEWLEYMLRKEKARAKDEDHFDDGLDDLLGFADVIGPGGPGLTGEDVQDGDDFADKNEFGSTDYSEGSDEGSSEADGSARSDSVNIEVDDEDWQGITSSRAVTPEAALQPIFTPGSSPSPEAAPTKYMPPAMRAAQLAEKASGDKDKIEERRKLERKLQGTLNKLSEANIEAMLGDIEAIYRDHSRNDVTTTITSLVLQMISNRANLLDSFVVLYATLVGALHRIIGLEFGAHFVHSLVMRYDEAAHGPKGLAPAEATLYGTLDASKESLNLLTLIAELYNAGVISSNLIYDLVRRFVESSSPAEVMNEVEVESLLKILKSCGPQMRSDDPASLKDIVGLVQDQSKGKEKTMTTRARFMVETLVNVKNGKQKSLPGEQIGAAAERMKRFLASLGRKRRLLAAEPLRVSLEDLLAADKKGKWWLVGAGWAGNPLVEHEQAQARLRAEQPKMPKAAPKEDEEVLLDLARKQGMNTDIRRSVFVVIMTSEDYMHACDRLKQLRMTDVQQREYIRVALHCCASEKRYNPFYTLILHNLCSESYDHRFTFQYALWDFLREISGSPTSNTRKRGSNIAKALAYLIARESMDLTVLKAVEWTELNSSTSSFLAALVVHLVLSSQTTSPLFALPKSFEPGNIDVEVVQEIFERSLSNAELAQGLAVLIRTELVKKLDKVLETLGYGDREAAVVKQSLAVARSVLAKAI